MGSKNDVCSNERHKNNMNSKYGCENRMIDWNSNKGTEINECGKHLRNKDGEVKLAPPLFMSVEYFKNLRKYKLEEEHKEEEARRKERLRDLEKSKCLSKNWPDTAENYLKAKEENELKRKKKYQEESDIILKEIEIANRETDRMILAKAKIKKFEAKQDVRDLLAASFLTEVINEQANQVKYKEEMNKLEEQEERKYCENEKRAIAEYFAKEAEKKKEKMKINLEYGRELVEQYTSKNELETLGAEEEKERERAFFAILANEIPDDSRKKKTQDFLESLKEYYSERELINEERRRDEELEDRHIKNYHESVLKLNEAMRKQKEKQKIESQKKRDAVIKLLSAYSEGKEQKEKEVYERGRKDLLEREERRILNDEIKKEKLNADFLASNIQQRKEIEEAKLAELQNKNLDRLRELKLTEDCRKMTDEMYQREKEKKSVMKAILKDQMALRSMRDEQEIEGPAKYLKKQLMAQRKDDEEILARGKDLFEKAKADGRNVWPIEKFLKKFDHLKDQN